jgi:hypothetical protein
MRLGTCQSIPEREAEVPSRQFQTRGSFSGAHFIPRAVQAFDLPADRGAITLVEVHQLLQTIVMEPFNKALHDVSGQVKASIEVEIHG